MAYSLIRYSVSVRLLVSAVYSACVSTWAVRTVGDETSSAVAVEIAVLTSSIVTPAVPPPPEAGGSIHCVS